MMWLGGILSFLVGTLIGAILYKAFRSDAAKIRKLEGQLQQLRHEHEDYQQQVHTHFHTSANLLHKLTDTYREVYRHMASNAQALCPENISSQLSLSRENHDLLKKESHNPDQSELFEEPPRDYAVNRKPEGKGQLSEEHGLKPLDKEQQFHQEPAPAAPNPDRRVQGTEA